MPQLLAIAKDSKQPLPVRQMATHFFIRGATRQGYVGMGLTPEEREWNEIIAQNHIYLETLRWKESDPPTMREEKLAALQAWYHRFDALYHLSFLKKKSGKRFFSPHAFLPI